MFSSVVQKIFIGLTVVFGFSAWGIADAYGLNEWNLFHRHRCCPHVDHGDCDSGCRSHHGCFSSILNGHCRHRNQIRHSYHASGCCGDSSTGRFDRDFEHDFDRDFGTAGARPIRIRPQLPIPFPHFSHQPGIGGRRRFRRPLLPPAGTLGWTYRKPSAPVPEDEHPRTGMLNVYRVPAGCTPTVDRMEGFRGTDGVWHFTTKRPLPPGIPHIYTVRFPLLHAGKHFRDARVVRLIPGRIVDLSY